MRIFFVCIGAVVGGYISFCLGWMKGEYSEQKRRKEQLQRAPKETCVHPVTACVDVDDRVIKCKMCDSYYNKNFLDLYKKPEPTDDVCPHLFHKQFPIGDGLMQCKNCRITYPQGDEAPRKK